MPPFEGHFRLIWARFFGLRMVEVTGWGRVCDPVANKNAFDLGFRIKNLGFRVSTP